MGKSKSKVITVHFAYEKRNGEQFEGEFELDCPTTMTPVDIRMEAMQHIIDLFKASKKDTIRSWFKA